MNERNELDALRLQLHSLVLFRSLLHDPVVCKLDKLLACAAEPLAALDAYADFAQALFATTENWSDYLLQAVLDTDNLCVQRCGAGLALSPTLQSCLTRELAILEHIALFDGIVLRGHLLMPMPPWRTHALQLQEQYARYLAQLPRTGHGMFARYHVFTVHNGALTPVKHPDAQHLDELTGYESERAQVLANTRALLVGQPANNVLLYGDAGTGKSSTVKAVANALADEGLRLIEVKKNQLYQIPALLDTLAENPLKFILFIDDLSFAANDDDFAALKAILEGSATGRSNNIAVYATSNRRHLVKETFADRAGDDIHLADTLQEVMSLSARFGLTVTFSKPDKELYCEIVQALAQVEELSIPTPQLLQQAEAYALRSGGRSPRTAKQFVRSLKAAQA